MRYKESFHRKPTGRCPDTPTEPPPHPNTYPVSRRRVCGTSPQYSSPRLRAHSSQAEGPRCIPLRATHTLPRTTGRGGGRKQGRGRYVPSRHQGVRSGARTGSLQEQGTYRLDPSNPSRILNSHPNHRIHPKTKPPYRTGKGVGRAADGNRTRVSGLGSVRSTIELQPHLFQCIALACWG